MDTLQHDPRTKQLIKDHLVQHLYQPLQKHFDNRLNQLILRNTVIAGHTHPSFSYKGVTYSNVTGPPPRKMNRLIPQLKDQMDEYLRDKKCLETKELPFVLGFINYVLNSSDHFDDYLKLFPDSLHQPLQQLAATYPCRSKKLSDEEVTQIRDKHQESIQMLRERMVTNLLI